MNEDWLERWQVGRTGWHEPEGNRNLQEHWTVSGRRVLVPLCGKTPDLLWLEAQGNEVVGVELSEIAVEAFFEENALAHEAVDGDLPGWRATDRNLTIYCGDFFDFRSDPFDAHYDRGALIALTPELRARYSRHVSSLLSDDAFQLVITIDYDQSVCDGPPFALSGEEIRGHWPTLRRHARVDDTANAPPKFLEAGLQEMHEVVWLSES
jgi:thiopurine S-methyltransferase